MWQLLLVPDLPHQVPARIDRIVAVHELDARASTRERDRMEGAERGQEFAEHAVRGRCSGGTEGRSQVVPEREHLLVVHDGVGQARLLRRVLRSRAGDR